MMQIYNQKQTSAKIGKQSDLGGSWAPFGKGLGRSGASWDHFWVHFVGRSKSYLFKTMVQDGLQEAFWMAFGSILGGFGEDLDASWENLGIQN